MAKPQNQEWTNYEIQPSFILGFHGCDAKVGEAVLCGDYPHLKASSNGYDWLGSGIYFWEGNPARALQFAEQCRKGARNSKGKIKTPFVLGAIINLGFCLDLADSSGIMQVKESAEILIDMAEGNNWDLPKNNGGYRPLDNLVFETFHNLRLAADLPPYETVRGLFFEGEPIYPQSQIRDSDHIQICVREETNILGYFRPLPPKSV